MNVKKSRKEIKEFEKKCEQFNKRSKLVSVNSIGVTLYVENYTSVTKIDVVIKELEDLRAMLKDCEAI